MSSPDPTATTAATTTAPAATPATGTVTPSSSTKTAKQTLLKVVTGFAKLTVNAIANLVGAVVKGMTGNTNFPNPPVDLTALAAAATAFSAAIIAAMDGGKNAKAALAQQKTQIIQNLKLLAVYVENNSNDNPAIITSSGFTAKSPTKTANVPVAVPTFRSINSGANSGQIVITVSAVDGAKAYFVRYTVMTDTAPGEWTTLPVASVKTKLTLSGLTPKTTYGFQVQALGTLGYSDWSTTATIICV